MSDHIAGWSKATTVARDTVLEYLQSEQDYWREEAQMLKEDGRNDAEIANAEALSEAYTDAIETLRALID